MKLYHGSTEIIEIPGFWKGNPKNDYGLGFYCTENPELAKEWACSLNRNGFANEYELNIDGLSVCNLGEGYHILNWLAILLENRTFDLSSGLASEAREYIIQSFVPDYRKYDIIRGYRADDSYFSFAKDFLNNSIPLETLSEAMKLGKLGEQVVLKSRAAFESLRFMASEPTDNSIYYPKRTARDRQAREDYQLRKTMVNPLKAVYIIDIIREKWHNDDERLQ